MRIVVIGTLGPNIAAGIKHTALGWLVVVSPATAASRQARRRCLLAVDATIAHLEAGDPCPVSGTDVITSHVA